MNICVIGVGYVGLISGTCFADAGHQVICIDKDAEKITQLNEGRIPIYEPDLEEIARENIASQRLRFSTDLQAGVNNSEIIFITVGTPEGTEGQADLQAVHEVALAIGQAMNDYKIIVIKSTVPVGTARKVEEWIKSQFRNPLPFGVVSNPEFLREGTAVYDNYNMDRVVIGTDDEYALYILKKLYQPFTQNVLVTNTATAELIKYASNAFLATKISFVNQIANICERVGADVKQVALGMGMDHRIGKAFLKAGVGYGGSCLPKDTKALLRISEQIDAPFTILREVIEANERQQLRVIEKLKLFYPNLTGKNIAVLGLTFKPNTDDLRYAPSHKVIEALLKEGASVRAYDPVVNRFNKNTFPGAQLFEDIYDALQGCEGAIILTEWEQVKKMDLKKAKASMSYPLLIDGRNIFVPEELRSIDFVYESIGR